VVLEAIALSKCSVAITAINDHNNYHTAYCCHKNLSRYRLLHLGHIQSSQTTAPLPMRRNRGGGEEEEEEGHWEQVKQAADNGNV